MKSLLLWLLALLGAAGAARAQELRGSYITATKERISSIRLFRFAGNQFYYQFDGCFGGRRGEGTYAVRDGQLHLTFRHSAADTMRHVWPLPNVPTNFFGTRVLVTSWFGTPLPRLPVRSKLLPYIQGTTNEAGIVDLPYHLLPFDELLVTTFGPDSPVSLPMYSAGNQCVRVRLGAPFGFFKAGETLTFLLKHATPDTLVVRQVWGPFIDDTNLPYEHYQSVSAEEAGKQMRHF